MSSIDDDGFGSLTSVHDNVLSTTCSVPQDIAKNGVYECGFKAHFCGGSHTNTASGTIHDDDNPTTGVVKSSNTLTVNVSATVGP